MVHSNSQSPVRPDKKTVKAKAKGFVSITTTKGGTKIRLVVHQKGLHSQLLLDATNERVKVKEEQHKWMPEDDRRLMAALDTLHANPPIELIDAGYNLGDAKAALERLDW